MLYVMSCFAHSCGFVIQSIFLSSVFRAPPPQYDRIAVVDDQITAAVD